MTVSPFSPYVSKNRNAGSTQVGAALSWRGFTRQRREPDDTQGGCFVQRHLHAFVALTKLLGLQVELARRGCKTDAFDAYQSFETLLCAKADSLALGHLNGCCSHGSPPIY
jgi:hypothetical protein